MLQIPLSIAFTRFLNVFSALLPDFPPENTLPLFALRLLTVICAIILTGIGAAASLNMRLIPNPGDGIVLAIALGFLFTGKLQGVGIGTVLAVIGVWKIHRRFQSLCPGQDEEAGGYPGLNVSVQPSGFLQLIFLKRAASGICDN